MSDPLVVYLVVRQSPDCSPRMVEIMGACMTLEDADHLREYIFEKKGQRCHVEWLHPEEPGQWKEK
jgi:hypothetical protein